jgi:hypothetical protein
MASPDPRSAQWGFVTRAGDQLPFVRVDDERIAVLLGTQNAEVWYVNELEGAYGPIEKVENIPTPDQTALACALTGLSQEDLMRLQTFCAEPRTMDEIDEEFPEAEAWQLRHSGILRDVGRKNRKITSVWEGYSWESLMKVVERSVSEAVEQDARKSGGR